MGKKNGWLNFICFFNIICLIVFFVVLIGIPICEAFFEIKIEKNIEMMWIFALLVVFMMISYLIILTIKNNLCKKEEDKTKYQLLKDASLESNSIKITEAQKEIYKIFCNTLVDL